VVRAQVLFSQYYTELEAGFPTLSEKIDKVAVQLLHKVN